MSKDESNDIIPLERIERAIYIIRGQKIILDQDFAFRLTIDEWDRLIFQIGRSKKGRGGRSHRRTSQNWI